MQAIRSSFLNTSNYSVNTEKNRLKQSSNLSFGISVSELPKDLKMVFHKDLPRLNKVIRNLCTDGNEGYLEIKKSYIDMDPVDGYPKRDVLSLYENFTHAIELLFKKQGKEPIKRAITYEIHNQEPIITGVVEYGEGNKGKFMSENFFMQNLSQYVNQEVLLMQKKADGIL